MWISEIKEHLTNKIIPFWSALRDDEFGGFWGYVGYDLQLDKKAVKGCILNSRILWFFSSAYRVLHDPQLLSDAKHAYVFLKKHCLDHEKGGVFWSLNYDGTPFDETKHTYNQAFAVYALSSYYDVTRDPEALQIAYGLVKLIETKCKDEVGYLEAFNRSFEPVDNDKLSENGVMADKTMNTLLHVLEAYTELYRVDHNPEVGKMLRWMMDVFADQVFNPALERQEVFFDAQMNSIIDLHSYGHDIETSWLIDRCCEALGDAAYTEKLSRVTKILAEKIYRRAYVDHSLLNECERGVDNTARIWWVQAETVVGFLNAYQKSPEKDYFLEAAVDVWHYIQEHIVDAREGGEWFYQCDAQGVPADFKPIVEPWKCPYHNGRMCLEVITRAVEA